MAGINRADYRVSTMGFDGYSADQPILNVHKKTTQVNLWMAVGVTLFVLAAILLISWSRSRHGPDEVHTTPEQQQSAPAKGSGG